MKTINTIDEMVDYMESEAHGPEIHKWRVVHDPEEIHQLRATGGSLMCPAIIGACGPSLRGKELPECAFWFRSDRGLTGHCATLEQAKANIERTK